MTFLFNDPLFDAELVKTLSHACYGGADINECINTADRIKEEDTESWYREWNQTAERTLAVARSCAGSGHNVSAREAHLRASSYFRASGAFLHGPPVDARLSRALDLESDSFRCAAALFDIPTEPMSLPFEGGSLPAYFFRADTSGSPRPALIVTGGEETTAEELYFLNAAAALRRGYHCLCFEGPGQGRLLARQGAPLRPDWESVISPLVDHLLSRPEVDPKRVAIMGFGLGGHLALRAASGEPRLSACIADPGQRSLLDLIKSGLPPVVRDQLPDGNRAALAIINSLWSRALRHPTRGAKLRRRMWAFGAQTPVEHAKICAHYDLSDISGQIRCPTLVCAAENDPSAAQAEELYTALLCSKRLLVFTGAEGAGDPGESGARSLFHQRAFNWLDEVFRITR